jgi:Cof subfamily protein (haloacid dehalogenase superfamily)
VSSAAVKLVLADVDGTLVTQDKVLTDRAVDAVRKLHDAGVTFAITSGRPPRGMAMLIEPLDLRTPIAAFNGGLIVDRDMKTIEQRVLPEDLVQPVAEMIGSAKLDVWVYRGADWYVPDKDGPHVAREAWTVKFQPKVVAGLDDSLDGVAKIVGISDDLDKVQQCEADAQAAFGQRATATRSQPYYLDVTHKDANKGAVVDYLSRHMNIPTEEIATLGDQPNDVLMFKRSGFSIAMGNASDQVKAQASATTDSYNDEGFAKAVERFILGISD